MSKNEKQKLLLKIKKDLDFLIFNSDDNERIPLEHAYETLNNIAS